MYEIYKVNLKLPKYDCWGFSFSSFGSSFFLVLSLGTTVGSGTVVPGTLGTLSTPGTLGTLGTPGTLGTLSS